MMEKIIYKVQENGDHRVYIGASRVGLIKKLKDGRYQYWPNSLKKYSDPEDIRDTVEEVKEICLNGKDED